MSAHDRVPLVRVWAVAVPTFLVAAWMSRQLAHRSTPIPSYWVGLIGLVAIGGALVWSWRGLGDAGVHAPFARRLLRVLVGLGVGLWVLAMVFPFL
jgi:hypothetical protein